MQKQILVLLILLATIGCNKSGGINSIHDQIDASHLMGEGNKKNEDCQLIGVQGIFRDTITVDGRERKYILYFPKKLPKNSPLVFVFHGYSDNAQNMMNDVDMNAVADENGFAVCYPQGLKDNSGYSFWEVGYDFTKDLGIDDVKFATTLASRLQQDYSLSAENTFATGMSNGADMCIMLACRAPQHFKAIAPVCGSLMNVIYRTSDTSTAIPVFMTNGTADKTTWWNGDKHNIQGYGKYLPVRGTLNFFAKKNQCQSFQIDTLPNLDLTDGSFVISEKHTNGINGNQVWLYKVVKGGHDWPGSYGNMDINSSVEAWNFFKLFL